MTRHGGAYQTGCDGNTTIKEEKRTDQEATNTISRLCDGKPISIANKRYLH